MSTFKPGDRVKVTHHGNRMATWLGYDTSRKDISRVQYDGEDFTVWKGTRWLELIPAEPAKVVTFNMTGTPSTGILGTVPSGPLTAEPAPTGCVSVSGDFGPGTFTVTPVAEPAPQPLYTKQGDRSIPVNDPAKERERVEKMAAEIQTELRQKYAEPPADIQPGDVYATAHGVEFDVIRLLGGADGDIEAIVPECGKRCLQQHFFRAAFKFVRRPVKEITLKSDCALISALERLATRVESYESFNITDWEKETTREYRALFPKEKP